jgi:3-methylcrotonyl-CoA carboxylase alpha subunit
MFNTLLIANRGEIACRIIKTAHQLGIECIAIYSTADRNSLHVKMADRAYCIGEPEARVSYLNIEAIISVAKQSGAEAIHPGYGFLSENMAFATACEKAGIMFVGPSVQAMKAMGSKQLAKQLLSKHSVPLTPGYQGDDQSDKKLLDEALKIGFPLLLKAANGGGGKGMRTVHSQADFQQALMGARREAKACFGDEIMIIEKYITRPRHVEIQLMADNFGNVVHLFDRDCSIQRRHQKMIEEAPAPNLSDTLRRQLADAAIAVARAIDYRGAGTIEFLVDGTSTFYFMEMNTRLQVEHPVTEMITGIDLVEWQLRIAANEPLPLKQEHIQSHGHAIECRIYAEDPHNQFLPSTGTVHFLREPEGPGIRIDSGIALNDQITNYYDPMIAKLITFGADRSEATQRLFQAMNHYSIGGVKTNLPLLQAIINHSEFKACHLSTHFLTEQTISMATPDIHWALLMAASVDYLSLISLTKSDLAISTFGWQMHLQRHWTVRYLINQEEYTLLITPINRDTLTITHLTESVTLQVKQTDSVLTVNDLKQLRHAHIDNQKDYMNLFTTAGTIQIQRFNWEHKTRESTSTKNQLTAPMPALIVAILKNKGDKIKAGEPLLVLEAMKMEHMILAPNDGVLTNVFFDVGVQVSEGAELVAIDILPAEEERS